MRIVTSRRSFLAGALATAAVPARMAFAGAVKTKVALQMYSVGRYVREVQTGGFAAVFRELADLGYKGVEFAGLLVLQWGGPRPERAPQAGLARTPCPGQQASKVYAVRRTTCPRSVSAHFKNLNSS